MRQTKLKVVIAKTVLPLLKQLWVVATFLLVIASKHSTALENTVPTADLSAQEVITIVVDSLKFNDDTDSGIATVYRFASPSNKSSTGPLPRFTLMIKRGFPEMLNHTDARYDALEVHADVAVQAVWLQTQSGAEFGYAFKLSKQKGGIYDGMWMTDAVIPLGESPNNGTGI